jgi:hypothetical protein
VILQVGCQQSRVEGDWQLGENDAEQAGLRGAQPSLHKQPEDRSIEEEQARVSLAQAFPEIAVAWQLKEALRIWYAIAPATTAATELDT